MVKTPAEVAEVVRVAGKLPVNVLAGWPGFTKRQLEDLGVKRISVGGALARAAWGGFIRAAKDIAGKAGSTPSPTGRLLPGSMNSSRVHATED